jgi:hypothetical protein
LRLFVLYFGRSNFDVIVFSCYFVGHPNFEVFKKKINVGEGIDFEFLIKELVSKSCFLEIDGKINKDIDECNVFCGFDTKKCIVDIFEDETFVEDLVNKLFFFLQLAKEDDNLYPTTMNLSFHLLNLFLFLMFNVFCYNILNLNQFKS